MYNNHLLTAVNESSVHETVMLFLKSDVKKKREFFSVFVSFDLLLTASKVYC